MARRYFIVVGDPTTGGGEAQAGYAGWRVECVDGSSRDVVRVGDPVMCAQCGPTTAIEGYRFALISGALLAYDGSALACGHKLISKMQRLFCWDEPEPSVPTVATKRLAFTALAETNSKYSVQFVVLDANGAPIPDFEYVLVDAVGNEVEGITDECGQTVRHRTSAYTRFALYPKEAPESAAANPDICWEC